MILCLGRACWREPLLRREASPQTLPAREGRDSRDLHIGIGIGACWLSAMLRREAIVPAGSDSDASIKVFAEEGVWGREHFLLKKGVSPPACLPRPRGYARRQRLLEAPSAGGYNAGVSHVEDGC